MFMVVTAEEGPEAMFEGAKAMAWPAIKDTSSDRSFIVYIYYLIIKNIYIQ